MKHCIVPVDSNKYSDYFLLIIQCKIKYLKYHIRHLKFKGYESDSFSKQNVVCSFIASESNTTLTPGSISHKVKATALCSSRENVKMLLTFASKIKAQFGIGTD